MTRTALEAPPLLLPGTEAALTPRLLWAFNRFRMETENRKSRRYGGRGRHHWYALLFLMRTLDVLLKLTRQHERGVRNACTELHGPIRPTMDRLRPLVSDVQVVGTDDVHYYFTDQAVHALEAARDAFTIALVHSPELFDVAADLGVDLYLCGHTHAGQVCLPGGRAVITHLRGGGASTGAPGSTGAWWASPTPARARPESPSGSTPAARFSP